MACGSRASCVRRAFASRCIRSPTSSASSSSMPRRADPRFVAVVGGDERAAGEVTIKDMTSGEQIAVPAGRGGVVAERSTCARGSPDQMCEP